MYLKNKRAVPQQKEKVLVKWHNISGILKELIVFR
jgi:hypothetical protein